MGDQSEANCIKSVLSAGNSLTDFTKLTAEQISQLKDLPVK